VPLHGVGVMIGATNLRGGIVRRIDVRLRALVSGIAVVAGCSSSAPATTATAEQGGSLTGYARVGPPSRPGVSGPVTVALNATTATRLASLLRQLPAGHGPHCIEPASLIYKIDLRTSSGDQKFAGVGYRCGAAVKIVTATGTSWHTDTGCRLIAEVRRDLPASARGTQGMSVGCTAS
jgi:hypothetical protein